MYDQDLFVYFLTTRHLNKLLENTDLSLGCYQRTNFENNKIHSSEINISIIALALKPFAFATKYY